MSQNYLLVCADLKRLPLLQRGISTPNKALTMRNFIPLQGNLKLVGFVARTPMRSTYQVRHMWAPSPVICHMLNYFTWAVGKQRTPKCICNSALGPVAEAHLQQGAALPAPSLGHCQTPPPFPQEVCRATMTLPAKKSPLLSPCSLPCLQYLPQPWRCKDKWKGRGISMQVLRGTYDLVCFADCQGKHDCPDKRVWERMPAVMRLVRWTTALQPNANSQQMDGKSLDCKRGHAMMQCNMQLLFIPVG